MGLNDTPSGERRHIGFFGVRNAGKSSLVNAVTGQTLSVVSDVAGTTTDPVRKAMELLPLGPVVILDTPGYDDAGELGELRVRKTREALSRTDAAVLVLDARTVPGSAEAELTALFRERSIPFLTVYTKADLLPDRPPLPDGALYVSARTGENIGILKDRLAALARPSEPPRRLLDGIDLDGGPVLLVIPIDESAPKGRLILPQQQTMRDLLDRGCPFAVCRDTELPRTLDLLNAPPKLVITDSQAFGRVARDVPESVPLTSFSILFARYRGDLARLVRGASVLSRLRDGDRVLISEGCTHHRQCKDIGTVKLPNWIRAFCGAEPAFSFTSGGEFPEDLAGYALVVHCGGCMLNAAELRERTRRADAAGVPMVNYGAAIAHMHGVLERSLRPFPEAARGW